MFSQTQVIQLTENWQMRQADTEKWIPAVVPGCVHSDLLRNKLILEPYFRTNEKGLQWIDKKNWEYKSVFDVSENQINKSNLELIFKGLDTYATVYLNNQKVLEADNMFREWIVDAKSYLKKGKNELRVYFHSPINNGLELLKTNGFTLHAANDQAVNGGLDKSELVSPFIRKAPYHFGWDWGPRFVTSAIWQPIIVHAWNDVKMNDFYVEQKSLTSRLAQLNGQIEVISDINLQSQITIFENEKVLIKKAVDLKKGINKIDIPFEIVKPKLWWTNGLGKANLYKITAHIKVNQTVDSKTHEIGLRTLKLIQKPDSAGHSFYFELNGVPVFAKGENHIPNDMFLDKVTNDVYNWEIQTAVKSNLNMIRVWGGGIYENDYFYELCDRNGILVWQDFMFACSMYPGNEWFLNSITKEAEYQVKRLRNHPSIALWCGNNEIDVAWQNFNPNSDWGWKKAYNESQKKQVWQAYDTIFNHILPASVKSLSANTAYWQSSPSSVVPQQHANDKNANGDVHYWGVWWGKHPFEKYADNIGRFMSEYGFQSFPELETVRKYALLEDYDIESEVMRHHQRSSIGNVTIKEYMDMYYRKPLSFEKFLYVGQVLQAYGIRFAIEGHRRAMPYNMGSLVWQINDCWPVASWSSCDYYKRWKALQYEIKRSFEPVAISVFEQNGNTEVTIISDKRHTINGTLELKLVDFTGKILDTKSQSVNLKVNAPTIVFAAKTTDLSSNPNGNFWLLTLRNGKSIIAQKVHYFTQPKNFQLTIPTIVSKIEKISDKWLISLKTDVLAKDVYLNFDGDKGFFEDNYFDLLPGKTKTVVYKLKASKKPTNDLSVVSLWNSYNE
jgi:beta-mannosidase